jgi:LacI family transcriptional regulator
MVTIRDVARRAGVSAGTVSNVLNRPAYVGAATRERVLTVIADLGFTPTAQARRFRTGRQRTLGLALADLANPFFVDVALGAEAEAKQRDVGVVMIHNGEDATREQHNLDILVQQRVHGMIIAPVHEDDPGLDRLDGRGIPLVYVDRVATSETRCWVKTDDVAGGLIAGAHLVSLGHRHTAFAGPFDAYAQTRLRYKGFRSAFEGLPGTVERFDTPSWGIDDGRAIGAALAARGRDALPTALMASNDLIALGVFLELSARGISVPGDVSLVGFDDLVWAGAVPVPLTTVRQPRAALGTHSVRFLLDEIDHPNEHEHQHLLLGSELVERASTSPPRPTT